MPSLGRRQGGVSDGSRHRRVLVPMSENSPAHAQSRLSGSISADPRWYSPTVVSGSMKITIVSSSMALISKVRRYSVAICSHVSGAQFFARRSNRASTRMSCSYERIGSINSRRPTSRNSRPLVAFSPTSQSSPAFASL